MRKKPPGRTPRPFDEFVGEADANGCWNWTGYLNEAGYGRMRARGYAHRISYELSVGPIPDGFQIDHLCRNTRCVNPAHLEAVTPLENVRRSTAPSTLVARTNRCYRGHPLTPENTIRRTDGYRQCRQCANASRRRLMAARRAETTRDLTDDWTDIQEEINR